MKIVHLPWGQRLDAVSPEVIKRSLMILAFYLTKKLKDRTSSGAFSEHVLGEPAVAYFSRRAINKLWTGSWKWKDTLSLSTQLIRIARSDMSHHVKSYYDNREPELKVTSQMSHGQQVEMDLASQELEEDLNGYETIQDMAYEVAEAMVSDDPELLKYIKAVKELNNYHAIAKRMKMTKAQLMEVETRLIDLLKNNKEQRRKIIQQKWQHNELIG